MLEARAFLESIGQCSRQSSIKVAKETLSLS